MNVYDYDEYDECDVFCTCQKCTGRREMEEREHDENKRKDNLEYYGFDRDEDLELSNMDMEYSYNNQYMKKKKIIRVIHETKLAILFEFKEYNAWFPKSILRKPYCEDGNWIEIIKNRKTIEYTKSFIITKLPKEDGYE